MQGGLDLDDLQEMATGLNALLKSVGDDDAVQEGFLRVQRRRHPGNLANPQGYWYRASHSALLDRRRRRVTEERAIRQWLEVGPRDAEQDRWSEGQLADLRRGIGKLSGKRLRLIDLELSGVHDGRLLAEELGISEGAVRVLRHRTYRQLRALVSG